LNEMSKTFRFTKSLSGGIFDSLLSRRTSSYKARQTSASRHDDRRKERAFAWSKRMQ
jgi:hypothetical protein